jgi:hypothetical protein
VRPWKESKTGRKCSRRVDKLENIERSKTHFILEERVEEVARFQGSIRSYF